MNKSNKIQFFSALTSCLKNPLYHFTKTLVSEWPTAKKDCTPSTKSFRMK